GFAGANGVWRLEDAMVAAQAELIFEVPNGFHPAGTKELWFQVTYQDVNGPPEVVVHYWPHPPGAQGTTVEVKPFQNIPNPGIKPGWKHITWKYKIPLCPVFELLYIRPPDGGVIYIDEAIVDTICVHNDGHRDRE